MISDPRMSAHDTGGGHHPETASRLEAIDRRLQNGFSGGIIEKVKSQPIDRQLLLAFHREEYLFRFEERALSGHSYLGHPDNQINHASYDAAMVSAGAGVVGIDLLENRDIKSVFCCTRPPGHHAERAMALGFCFFNNCAVAARYWQQRYNRRRILILDIDAHHGNGIQAAFEEDPEVLYVSIHEHPSFSFPGTGFAEENGSGSGKGMVLNIPLLPGAGDNEVLDAITEKVGPAIIAFEPEAILVAAGFDGHRQDDMSGLNYSTDLFLQLGLSIGKWAEQFSCGKVLSILEGGYHLDSLAESVEAYLIGLTSP